MTPCSNQCFTAEFACALEHHANGLLVCFPRQTLAARYQSTPQPLEDLGQPLSMPHNAATINDYGSCEAHSAAGGSAANLASPVGKPGPTCDGPGKEDLMLQQQHISREPAAASAAPGIEHSMASELHAQPISAGSAVGNIAAMQIPGILTRLPSAVEMELQTAPSAATAARQSRPQKGHSKISEMRVMRAFMQVLQQPKLEPTSDFFEWGGHSLAAAEVAAGLDIPPALIAAYPTARKLAKYLASTASCSEPAAVSKPHGAGESHGIVDLSAGAHTHVVASGI